jgi:O-acetyl-ADP-ribose deacetylase (regulator of RNase III)
MKGHTITMMAIFFNRDFEMTEFRVVCGDITQMDVDAIVNAANNSLLGGGGVDGAIHRAAGPALLEFNRTLGGCPDGEVRLSPGFGLRARWIIHGVGPVWRGGHVGEAAVLASVYRQAVAAAQAKSLKTLAFPAISCGAYGYPVDEALEIAVSSLRAAAMNTGIRTIYLVGFDQAMAAKMRKSLEDTPDPSDVRADRPS